MGKMARVMTRKKVKIFPQSASVMARVNSSGTSGLEDEIYRR